MLPNISFNYYLKLISKRFSSNFVLEAGFSPKTKKSKYGNKSLLILDEECYLTYNDVNIRCGRMAECLSSIYKINVSFFSYYLFKFFLLFT